MMGKIKAAVVGYGNIGKYVLDTLREAPDFEVAGVVRRDVTEIPTELKEYNVVDELDKLGRVDVALLCVPSRRVEEYALSYLKKGIHCVDSFDIHSRIPELRNLLHATALKHDAVSIIGAGWDPGSDSVVRTLFEALAPKGITYTNFGPGMSMGHTVAAKAIDGVKSALSMTIPAGTGIHRRMVYVEIEEGHNFNQIAKKIKEDDYFVHDDTHVFQVEDVEKLKDMGHGVLMERKGVSGKTQNQLFRFDMRVNNPALTAQVLVSAARASMRQQPGAYTLVEIPVIDLLPGDKEVWIKKLV